MFCLFHDDEVIAVDHGLRANLVDSAIEAQQQSNEWLVKGVGTPYTRLLYRCKKCYRPKSTTVDGHWTIEQIRGGAVTKKEA